MGWKGRETGIWKGRWWILIRDIRRCLDWKSYWRSRTARLLEDRERYEKEDAAFGLWLPSADLDG